MIIYCTSEWLRGGTVRHHVTLNSNHDYCSSKAQLRQVTVPLFEWLAAFRIEYTHFDSHHGKSKTKPTMQIYHHLPMNITRNGSRSR